jgi:hypothetical protein
MKMKQQGTTEIEASECVSLGINRGTYSLGFFFGPGLPLGFGRPSVPSDPRPLFDPGMGPFLFLGGSAGVAPSVGGAGVEFESDGLSVEELFFLASGFSSTTASGVEIDGVDCDSFGDGLGRKRARRADGRRRMTTFFCLFILSTRPLVSGGEVMVEGGVDMVMGSRWSW